MQEECGRYVCQSSRESTAMGLEAPRLAETPGPRAWQHDDLLDDDVVEREQGEAAANPPW